MQIVSCRRGLFIYLTLALVCAVVWIGNCPTAEAEKRLEIPAWSFDRGNGRVIENPHPYSDYRDMFPDLVVVGGDKLPWQIEYDVDVPADATYTLGVRYGSPERRPMELWLDGKKVATCCERVTGDAPPYLDRHPKHDRPRPAEGGAADSGRRLHRGGHSVGDSRIQGRRGTQGRRRSPVQLGVHDRRPGEGEARAEEPQAADGSC